MPGRNTLLGGLAVVTALVVTGCSGPPSGTTPPPAGGGSPAAAPVDPAVQWAGGLCDAVTPAGTLGKKLSTMDGTTPDGIAKVLDAATAALRQSTTALDGVKASPIAGADAVVGDVKQALAKTATGIADTRAKAAAGDEAAATRALTTLTTGLDSLTRITDAPGDSPLAAATARAPSCRTLIQGG